MFYIAKSKGSARLVAICLSLIVALTFVPFMGNDSTEVYADTEDISVWDGEYDYTWYDDGTATSYTIESAAQFAAFAKIVNNKIGTAQAGPVTDSAVKIDPDIPADDFVRGTPNASGNITPTMEYTQAEVTLNVDIDLGATEVTPGGWSFPEGEAPQWETPVWQGNEWESIGAYGSSGAHADGSNDGARGRPFKGIFNGNLHEISNVYIPNQSTDINVANNNSHGLFAELGQIGIVKNIIVKSGYIVGSRYAAGIVGRSWGRIESCANYATIETFGDRSGGGIAGVSYSNGSIGYIKNCYNAGNIAKGDRRSPGGITGDNERPIDNCYNIGLGGLKGSYANNLMGGANGGGHADDGMITNCYSLAGDNRPTSIVGYYPSSTRVVGGGIVTSEVLKSGAFVASLGEAFDVDFYGLNDGYPVLKGMGKALSEMPELVDELTDEIDGLNDEIDGLNDEIDGLNDEISDLNDEINGLNDNLDELNSELDRQRTETRNTLSEIEKLEADISNRLAEYNALLTQLNASKALLAASETQLATTKAQQTAISDTQTAAPDTQIAALEAQLTSAQQAAFKNDVPASVKATAGKKQATLAWKKIANTDGYQITYSKTKNFKNSKTVTVKNATTVKTTIKKLEGGKTYYFKVRGYSKIGDKTVYTKWSKVIKKKINK
jgi:predicted  nucleic acid-binding Zn-ribbon protein